jgi:hypothetical protein
MKRTLILSLTVVWVVACGGDSDKRASQQEFETVQEGSVAGVTSTLGGPGENLPPITGTNADTTTDFGINPALAGAATPAPGTVPPPVTPAYGTTPPPPMTSATPAYDPTPEPVRSTPAATPRPAPVQPRPLENERETTPPVTSEPAPAPPTQTDTVASPPPQPEQEPEEEDSAPTQTDTSSTEPPPPPPPSF